MSYTRGEKVDYVTDGCEENEQTKTIHSWEKYTYLKMCSDAQIFIIFSGLSDTTREPAT